MRERPRARGEPGRLAVQRRALAHADGAVDGGMDACPRELAAPSVDGRLLREQAGPGGLLKRGQRVGQVRQHRRVADAARHAKDGGRGHQALAWHAAARELAQHADLQGLGDGQRDLGRRQRHVQRLPRHRLQHLPDMQRHAVGVLAQAPRRPHGQRANAGALGEFPDVTIVEPGQFDRGAAVADHPDKAWRQVLISIVAHRENHEQRLLTQPPERVAERAQRHVVTPLRVVNDEHRPSGTGRHGPLAAPLAHHCEQRGPRPQRVGATFRGSEPALLDQAAVQCGLVLVPGGPSGPGHPGIEELPDQRRLADPGGSDDHDALAAPRNSAAQQTVKHREFGCAPHEILIHGPIPPAAVSTPSVSAPSEFSFTRQRTAGQCAPTPFHGKPPPTHAPAQTLGPQTRGPSLGRPRAALSQRLGMRAVGPPSTT